jgi:heat shock protein HtpX
MNTFKTFILMMVMMGLFLFIGNAIGGRQGMVMAFIFASAMNLFMYWFSDKIVLAMYSAKPVSESDAPEIYRIVRGLTQSKGMPMPKIYILPMAIPNAFATGRNPSHSAVAVTSGILGILNEKELEGVIAHELSHIKHRDILIATIVATMAGAISMLARMAQWAAIFGGGSRDDEDRGGGMGLLVMAIVAPIAALLIQLAVSRSREYAADEGAAELSGNPAALASALKKLENYSGRIESKVEPATAHMFIVNPLSGSSFLKLFSTHPPIQERVRRLEAMAGKNYPRVIY